MTDINIVQMIDIRLSESVEIVIDSTGKKLWVNVDGICRLRCQHIKVLVIDNQTLKE